MEVGCYNIVGDDTIISANTMMRGDVYLIELQSNNITVQPGDVVGYFVARNSHRQIEGVVLNRNQGTESVWYSSVEPPIEVRPDSCQVSVGTNGTLRPGNFRSFTNAAPVLSIRIGNYNFDR